MFIMAMLITFSALKPMLNGPTLWSPMQNEVSNKHSTKVTDTFNLYCELTSFDSHERYFFVETKTKTNPLQDHGL